MDVKRRRVAGMRQITLHDAFANNKRWIVFLCMYWIKKNSDISFKMTLRCIIFCHVE
jgi:hypothetical protein